MPRLNIEEFFWVEIIQLAVALGDHDKAIGMAIRFFRIAQLKHREGLYLSEEDFKQNGFSEALLPMFGERTESGIRCRGSEKHFSWLENKKTAGKIGGEASGQARRSKTKQTEANGSKPNETNQREPSPSLSSSSKEEEVYINSEFEFRAAVKKYLECFPGTTRGPKAQERYSEQIKTSAAAKSLLAAISHYKAHLDFTNKDRKWKSPKTTFANFLGTKRSGYFWHDHITSTTPAPVNPAGSLRAY